MEQTRWLSDGALAIEFIAPDIGDILRDMALTAQGRPWPVAHAFGLRMRELAASTTAGTDAADVVLRLHITGLLELLGADPDNCDDPFQCGLYLTTVRQDFALTAKKYVLDHGGNAAVTQMMWARLVEVPTQKAKPARPTAMKVRLAQDADGPRIGELARASGFGVDGIDWSRVHPCWLVAERNGEVIGAIQIILAKPIGWLEMLSLDPDLGHRDQAMAVKALVERGALSLKFFGAQVAMGTVSEGRESYMRSLEKRGAVVVASGKLFAKRL